MHVRSFLRNVIVLCTVCVMYTVMFVAMVTDDLMLLLPGRRREDKGAHTNANDGQREET